MIAYTTRSVFLAMVVVYPLSAGLFVAPRVSAGGLLQSLL
jgi:hypothetical protein